MYAKANQLLVFLFVMNIQENIRTFATCIHVNSLMQTNNLRFSKISFSVRFHISKIHTEFMLQIILMVSWMFRANLKNKQLVRLSIHMQRIRIRRPHFKMHNLISIWSKAIGVCKDQLILTFSNYSENL